MVPVVESIFAPSLGNIVSAFIPMVSYAFIVAELSNSMVKLLKSLQVQSEAPIDFEVGPSVIKEHRNSEIRDCPPKLVAESKITPMVDPREKLVSNR